MNPMSVLSPVRLRRAASSASTDFGLTSSMFNDESWNNYDSRGFHFPASSSDLQRSAGSGVALKSNYGGVSKRIVSNGSHNKPETPMRKVRGQSVSGFSNAGLITPQSASQSDSSTSLHCAPGQSLPSPLETPLATPISGPLDNTLDYFYDMKQNQDLNGTFDLPLAAPAQSTPFARYDLAKGFSASGFHAKSDEDYQSASFSGLSKPRSIATKHMNSGTNPFYCPPPCLRTRSVSEMPNNKQMPYLDNYSNLHVSLADDGAGASLKVSDGSMSFNPGFDEASKVAFGSEEGPQQLFDKCFDNSNVHDLDFCAGPVFNPSSHFHFPDELPVFKRDHSVMSIPHLSRSRSSSNASCNSIESDKPFLCSLCTKRFRRMEHLRRHQKTHTHERPFKCTVVNCGRRFSRTDNLKAHMLTHTKKSGRNEYIEGLAEMQDIKPIKRRKPRNIDTQFSA